MAFRDRINADGTDARAIDGALDCIDSAKAETSVPADTESIRALVQGYAGGFGTLDDTVKRYLRRWFVSQGGVRVAARHGRAVGRAGQAQPVQRPGRVERVHVARFVGSGGGPASGGGGATISPPDSAAVVAAGDRSSSRHVDNPAYDVQGAYEDMLDPETAIAMPRPPTTRSLAPTMGACNIGHVTGSDAIDGGYMDVVGGTPPPPGRLESDVSLITDGLDRQESDDSLITDPGIMPRRLSSQSEL